MKYKIGDSAELAFTFSDQAVRAFADLSQDQNPVHLDDDYAAKTLFGRRIVHGMFVSALISRVLGTRLPGPGTIYLNQELSFVKPVYIGDTITCRATVAEVKAEKSIYILDTICQNEKKEMVVKGRAVIKYLGE